MTGSHNYFIPKNSRLIMKKFILLTVLIIQLLSYTCRTNGQTPDLDKSLRGFDKYIEQVMNEWNTPGIAVGIVIKDKLEYWKGFGYRNIDNKLPVTSRTLFPIASNTKLFTSVAMGMLVEEDKLAWDKPVSNYVPQIKFYNQELYNAITLRDMLAHRTGISRHDLIWYKSDFSRKEIFDRIKYLEPVQPIRQGSLYNNLMYAAAGYCLEILTGKTWENFVRENIFIPLKMNSTFFTIEEMEIQDDFAYPYYEDRETGKLIKRPFYREFEGVGPCGSIISNIEDMSKWVITLMDQGNYEGKNVISSDILKETLQPAMAYPNTELETQGYDEILNSVYGMGRGIAAYKGHYFTRHGGSIGGFYSLVSMMPYDSVGVIVFVNGAHNGSLPSTISYNIYDRLLGLEQTDFNGRRLKNRIEGKEADKKARANAGSDRIANTKASHPLEDYQGRYENPAYGILNIGIEGQALEFDFHNIVLPMEHFHYERFDTPDDQIYGKFSVNFSVNPKGDVHTAMVSLDESEVSFIKMADETLSDPETLIKYAGKYELAGTIIEIAVKEAGVLMINLPGEPVYTLLPYKSQEFTFKEFSDTTIKFVMDGDKVTMMQIISPAGTYDYIRIYQ
jgi:CubicO group peptidase (beta-lactamase class C family)